MIKAEKDDHTRFENLQTQPLRIMKIFNNSAVITEGWYPVCPSRDVKTGKVKSVLITFQRIAVYRGMDGVVRALDAFCAHMGADLGNGRVIGNSLQCYFHQWQYSAEGKLESARAATKVPKGICQRSYPVEERYGMIWVYAGEKARHPVPVPATFEGKELVTWRISGLKLYAHHHVMMLGGIDLLHFASVHGLEAKFKYDIKDRDDETADWEIEGAFPETGWRPRLGRWFLGESFKYTARFSGGSVVSLTYGPDQRFGGNGRPLTPMAVLWGCVAGADGISGIDVFLVTPKRKGIFGGLKSQIYLAFTALLLSVLRDDDIKAFPHMRFQINNALLEDQCAIRFVKWVERLRPSAWSRLPKNAPEQAMEESKL